MTKPLPLLILLFCSLFSFASAGSIVKGTITDKGGQPLIGATIALKNEINGNKIYTSAGLDGSYIFKNIDAGKYEIEAKYVSYKSESKNIVVNGAVVIVDISLASKSGSLTEVAVSGRANKTSDQAAINAERRSDVILNAVSARTIEASPDITIANVTQRISGVSVERSNNGEAQYAIIRGMDQRYEYTLVNGIKIPSPDNKNRYVPLDIFPADIVDRLEVSKSLTPNMEGDAIAGAINMVLKSAPDDFTVLANVGTGYAGNFFNGKGFTQFDHSASLTTSPRVSGNTAATMADFPNNPFHYSQDKTPLGSILGLTIGGRTPDKKFGAIVTLSYQNTFRQTNGTFFNSTTNEETSQPELTSQQSRTYDIQQERTAAITKFDYRFDTNNRISLDADYINLTKNEYRFTSDTSLLTSHTQPGIGSVDQDYRSDRTVQQIYNFDLHGDHKLSDKWKMDWSAVYSKATANEPDRADLYITTGANLDPTTGAIVQSPQRLSTNPYAQSRVFEENSDADKIGYLNLTYSPTIFGTVVDFSAGGMYRDKTRHSTYDDYNINESGATNQIYDGNINDNSFAVQNTAGSASDALNYDFTEKIGAGYGMFKFTAGNLLAIGGVRYENTNQQWTTGAPVNSVIGANGSISYFDVLPSLNLKYTLDNKQDVRFSYYSAISRPNFYELIPHTEGDPDADYTEVGNPYLKRITSNNLDLRYEFFPQALDQLLAGVFYKNIQNPIEYAVVLPPHAVDYVLEPENFGNANNYGFELDATKYVRNFGLRLNYTYTNSEITTTKLLDYRDANGNLTHRDVTQTRPLQDQSKNIGNLSFLYREPKSGFDAQVSAVYTGARIYAVSPYLDNDIWQKGFVTLDVSAEKKIFKKFYIYAKATNLTNTPLQLEIHRPYTPQANVFEDQTVGKNIFIRKDTYDQYYILGIRYKL
ncbi:TonB-dependent receptor [Mucilaginibacter sp. L196]|uniref:TonB-dependent receptor n=1 Tax=Mucilaginibacter sp. L196 TaxID=1641870 RepID=UPI00131B6E0D|nr:TonB-dependent receptor [Mucilaginibacter sp. L196]